MSTTHTLRVRATAPPALAVVAAFAVLAVAGCGESRPPAERPPAAGQAAPVLLRDVAFAPELEVSVDDMTEIDDGVLIQDLRPGRGRAAEPGDAVAAEYRAWLPDGTLFEQRPSPEGFGVSEFVLGENAPVPGLNQALVGIRPGGVRRVVLGPDHGYGLVGRPAGVPARSVLVFEVRVVRVGGAQ
jgi:hypothetical protein